MNVKIDCEISFKLLDEMKFYLTHLGKMNFDHIFYLKLFYVQVLVVLDNVINHFSDWINNRNILFG